MKQNKLPKQIPKIATTTIDADVLARINDKVAKAYEQNGEQKKYHFRKYRTKADIPTYKASNLDI